MPNPLSTFKKYWRQAHAKKDTTADYISLATIDAKKHPQVRTVLLKTCDAKGIGFVTQSLGRKAKSLRARPQVACCMAWPKLNLQVRFSGKAKPMPKALLQKFWTKRLREAQLLYHLGIPQSSVIPSFESLLKGIDNVSKKWKGKKKVPLSDYYIGFVVEVNEIEFLYHRDTRLNKREYFKKTSNGWVKSILAP